MTNHAIETIVKNGFTLNIYQDDDPINPRQEFDHLGTMALFHKRYELGDKHKLSIEDCERIEKDTDHYISLSVYGYDHGNLTISTKPFGGPFDSGKLGIIFISKADARKEYGVKLLQKKRLEQVYDILKSEVAEYDQFLTGNAYGYTITNKDNEQIDSCWSHYGFDYCKSEAEQSLNNFANKEPIQLELPLTYQAKA